MCKKVTDVLLLGSVGLESQRKVTCAVSDSGLKDMFVAEM